jgi:alanine racemase
LAVKANAYGHGAVTIAQTALDWGVHALGVATLAEALELRQAGISSPILLYGISAPEELPLLLQCQVEPFLASMNQTVHLAELASHHNTPIRVHIKVDTGMGRIGCSPEEALAIGCYVTKHPKLTLAGLCTHFPVAETNPQFTVAQVLSLKDLGQEFRRQNIDPGLLHAANSAGLVLHPTSHLDMVRPGLLAYGYPPVRPCPSCDTVLPVMELRSSLRFVKRVQAGTAISYGLRWTSPRDTWIGTIPLGYADGLPRLSSGGFHVQIKHRSYPQVGTICMDQCMIDLGPETPPALESPVTIFGPGAENNGADTLAQTIGTIPYEILCGISTRVPRVTWVPQPTSNEF